MKILIVGSKSRGRNCLQALCSRYQIVGAIVDAFGNAPDAQDPFRQLAEQLKVPLFESVNFNDPEHIAVWKSLQPDLIMLTGASRIAQKNFLSVAKFGCVNLHGGKLPKYRGSSPMNWALINDEKEFTICIVQVNEGIDSGDVLIEKTFPILLTDTIKDLHEKANEAFPQMLLEVVDQMEKSLLRPRRQDPAGASYYPLRFPEDGLILWDVYTAREIHNRIRALTDPYPGAFTYYKARKIKLLKSSYTNHPFYGEPGRVYQIKGERALVCAKDQCVWLDDFVDAETLEHIHPDVKRYEKLATLRDNISVIYENQRF